MKGSSLAAALSCLMVASCVGDQKPAVVVNNVNANLAAQPGAPGVPPVMVRGAQSGVRSKLGSFLSITPDCKSVGDQVIKVVKYPDHGKFDTEKAEDYPGFMKNNVRSSCNSQKVPATIGYYTSEPGFTGTDTLTIEDITPDGGYYRLTYTVNVR